MIEIKPKAGDYFLLKDMGLDELVRVVRVAKKKYSDTVYVWYRRHSWSTGQELFGTSKRRPITSFMQKAKKIPDLPALMRFKKAEREAAEAKAKEHREKKDAQAAQAAAACEECSTKTRQTLCLAKRTLQYILDNDTEPGKSPQGVAIQLNKELRHRVERSLAKLREEIG